MRFPHWFPSRDLLRYSDPELEDRPLTLVIGRFRLRRDRLPQARTTFVRWYCDRGQQWLAGKVREYARRIEVEPTLVRVQDLGYRRSSCGKRATLYFHWKTILLPRPIVEYVVVHELAHLHEPHHTPAFRQRVEQVLPAYERRKRWLTEHGLEV